MRHGARTPADTYPNDPHVNETFKPYGWGHITNVSNASIKSINDFSYYFVFFFFLNIKFKLIK